MPIIYHYEAHYKFFLCKEEITERQQGVGLPAHSTEIPPPIDNCQENQIPVFENGNWKIVEDNFWRPTTTELNYDAGRPVSSYKPDLFNSLGIQFPKYPSMPMLCNSQRVVMAICEKNNFIHKKFEALLSQHKKMLESYSVMLPSTLFELKLESESMIFLMKRVLDSLVQLTYLLTSFPEFLETKQIQFNEIGKFVTIENPKLEIQKIIVGNNCYYDSDPTNFLCVINDLFNSYKHSLMHDESYTILGQDIPTLVSYQAKRNNHSKEIIYHNHNSYHIMMGYQDTVNRILKNQHKYLTKHSSGQLKPPLS